MAVVDPAIDQPRFADLTVAVRIDVSPDTVWKALTDDIGRWWPSSFYCGASNREGATPRFKLEARPGGRMWEDWGQGDGMVWATVDSIVHGKSLEMSGTMGAAWGGPSVWVGGFGLEASGDGTELRFTESGFGRVSDGGTEEKTKGWKFLLACLKADVEGTEPPVWE